MNKKTLALIILLLNFFNFSCLKNVKAFLSIQNDKFSENEFISPQKNIQIESKKPKVPEKLSVNEIDKVLYRFIDISKKNPEIYYTLIFSSNEKKIDNNFTQFKNKVKVHHFMVDSDSNSDYTNIFLIKNGELIENKKHEFESKENKNTTESLQTNYQLQKNIKSKTLYQKTEIISEKDYYSFLEIMDTYNKGKDQRLIRFVWASILVLVFTISLFLFVKYSIDWATVSRNELNKERDQSYREITEAIAREF